MRTLYLFILLALVSTPASAETLEQALPIDAWARVLENFVDEQGRTNFLALAGSPNDLEAFVAHLAEHGPKSERSIYDSPAKVLAFHLNAYNALAMQGIIDKGIPQAFDSIFKRARFFTFRKVKVDGERQSLSAYENDIIRPLGDPRVHFALNCMVRDCPRLPQIPFNAETLNEQLEALSEEFFNNEKHLRVLQSSKQVQVSEILKFYTYDFAPSGKLKDLIPYINQFRPAPIPEHWQVEFIDYDWTVNRQP